jgi:hypothetical protein
MGWGLNAMDQASLVYPNRRRFPSRLLLLNLAGPSIEELERVSLPGEISGLAARAFTRTTTDQMITRETRLPGTSGSKTHSVSLILLSRSQETSVECAAAMVAGPRNGVLRVLPRIAA